MAEGIEREKRNSSAGYIRSVRTLMKRGGYVPDPQREARLRRVTRTRNQLIRDLGGDPSKAQTLLATNAAIFAVWLQDNAGRMLGDSTIESREFVNVASALARTLQTLGIERRPKDVLTLDRYLKEKMDDPADITPQGSD